MFHWNRNIGKIGWVGITISAVYLVVLHWIIGGRWCELRDQELNNIGDFLAGAFGPLAILWLVLGFFQQGIELRQNSAALKLQAKELANSVEQQRQLVETSRDSLSAQLRGLEYGEKISKESKRPVLLIQKNDTQQAGDHNGKDRWVITAFLINSGTLCSNFTIKSTSGHIRCNLPKVVSHPNQEFLIVLEINLSYKDYDKDTLILTCKNSDGDPYSTNLQIIKTAAMRPEIVSNGRFEPV